MCNANYVANKQNFFFLNWRLYSVEDIVKVIQRKQWYGHVLRKDD